MKLIIGDINITIVKYTKKKEKLLKEFNLLYCKL
jgi:hypothetical protein